MADRNAALFTRDAGDAKTSWLRSGSLRRGTLAELASSGADAHVWLVDSRLLQLAEVELPEAGRRVQAQALPYALEDQLLTPVDELSFASCRLSPTRLACAVFGTAMLETALAELTVAGLRVVEAVPDVLCVPWQESSWTLLFDGEDAWLRTGPYAGQRFAAEQWPAFVGQALVGVAGEQHVRVFGCEETLPARIGAAFPALVLDAQSRQRELLPVFAEGYAQGLTLDLLGALPHRGQSGGSPRRWWWAIAALLAGTAVGHASFMAWHTAMLDTDLRVARAQTLETFQALFPRITRVEDIRVQAAQALAELEAGADRGAPFLELLATAASALPADAAPSFESVGYSEGSLEIRVGARDMTALERYQQALAGAHLPVQLVSVETREDGAVGLIRIGSQR